ncbi:MAG: ERCC4 domain-containing protein, partial [Candidatus Aenigmatarchaeota archaeon]
LPPKEKIIIISDYREKEVSEILKSFDVKVNEMNLMVGDFICSERVAVERKSHSDFIGSIIDGRIFDQAKLLKENFESPIIIIEGSSNREINENALKAALSSLIIDFGISVVNTRNTKDTARMIYWLAKKEQEENKFFPSFKVGKKPQDLKTIQEFVLSSFPGISYVLAKRLLKNFKSIKKIINANENDLQKVRGIGKKLAKKIKDFVEVEYKE